jgi:hypothetical protein
VSIVKQESREPPPTSDTTGIQTGEGNMGHLKMSKGGPFVGFCRRKRRIWNIQSTGLSGEVLDNLLQFDSQLEVSGTIMRTRAPI